MDKDRLEEELEKIQQLLIAQEPVAQGISASVHGQYHISAKNLYRYLLLRSSDIRGIQGILSELGISSLGSAAGYVFENVSSALHLVKLLNDKPSQKDLSIESIGFSGSNQLLVDHTNTLFTSKKKAHETEIMVTMPDEAATDKQLLERLFLAGMGIARINLSHGDVELWQNMVKNLKNVTQTLDLPLRIYMDLPGPKIRTTELFIKEASDKRPQQLEFLRLAQGDEVILTYMPSFKSDLEIGEKQLNIPFVGVSLPQVIDDLQVGHRVFFDDGTFEGEVISKAPDKIGLSIIKVHKKKLRPEKGINLPDTYLNLPSLTEEDLELLPFVIEHADIVGYSFVRNAADVGKLYRELHKLNDSKTGVIFKIENREAFDNLPLILFEAMKRPNIGVMIARGDLAVEIGFERISEVQNQILWLCEAGQIPVIWATQVLDTLAKKGIATRAEISDATISAQAECVMLNKGPFIVEAVQTLKNVLKRMESHSLKKKNTLRALKVAKKSLERIDNGEVPFSG
ncbi:MAG TPA: pyruvate kinase [Arenibacter sp.]|nr:pyruvate kinase [Arenibacter sp.]